MDNMGQLYVNKLLNLNEMDEFIETHKLAKLTQEEMESLSRPLTSKQTEAVIRTQQGKKPEPDAFIGVLSQILNRKQILNSSKSTKQTHLNSFCDDINITPKIL